MKSGFKWILERFDYFGQEMVLNFNKEKKFRTTLGGILSLIIYGVSLSIIVILGMQLIYRANPKTTYTRKNLGTAPKIKLKEQGSVFLSYFHPPDDYGHFNDPTYIDISWYQFTSIRYDNGTQITNKTKLSTKNCTEYYNNFVEQGLGNYFTFNNLHLSECLNMDHDIEIGGRFASNFYSNIYVVFNFCRNSTNSNIICKPIEEINKKIYDGYFNLIYLDKYVDVNNFEKPFVSYVNTYFQKTDPKLFKKIDLFFDNADVASDIGLIFPERKHDTGLLVETSSQDIILNSGSKSIMNIYINISENSSLYIRSYMKIQELAALFGGIFQAMNLVGFIITQFISTHKMYGYMFNSLFILKGEKLEKHFVTPHEEIKKLTLFMEGLRQTSNRCVNRYEKASPYAPVIKEKNYNSEKVLCSYNSGDDKINVAKNIDQKILEYKSKTSKKFRFGSRDIIYMYLCGCCNKNARTKRTIFQMGSKKLLKYMDFLEIIKTLQQFHQLKEILLTKKQTKLLNFYRKPEMSNQTNIQNLKNSDSSYVDLYNCYNKLLQKTDNKINRKLIENFDESLKEIFSSINASKN